MKKNKILSAFLIIALVIVGCTNNNNEDYNVPYDDYSSFKTFVLGGGIGERDGFERSINVNDYLSLHDISQNAIDHEWILPSSVKFISDAFTNNDSIYDRFIIGEGTSKEKLINVLFKEAGIKEIILSNVFEHEVDGAVEESGVWVKKQVFTVDVFANTNPACKVSKYEYTDPDNPTLVEVLTLTEDNMPSINNKSSWPTVIIEAGEELVYEDLSVSGRPTGRKWYVEGGKPETSGSEVAAIEYNKLGEFTASMESIRNITDVPKYTALKLIPLIIKVIPSTKPFTESGNARMNEDGVISFGVSGEAESVLGQEDKFTVHVTNTASGFDQNIPVASVAINSDDATKIELTLSEPVFNTDNIEIYFADGNITSVDDRVLESFGPLQVKIDLGSSILVDSWASYEIASSNWRQALVQGYSVGRTNDDGPGGSEFPIWARTTEMASRGNASMSYTFDISKSVKLQGSDFAKPNGIPAGDYNVSYTIYLESGNTMKAFKTVLQEPSMTIVWAVEDLPRGEWITLNRVVTIPSEVPSGKRFDLSIGPDDNPGVTGEQKMYFDNLKWIPLNPR